MRLLALAVLLLVLAAAVNAMYWAIGNKTCVDVLFASGKKFCYVPAPLPNTTVTINISDISNNKNFTTVAVASALVYKYGNITIGGKSFLVPAVGSSLSFGQPVVLFAPQVIAYDEYSMSAIEIPAGLLIETSATVVDASGNAPVRGVVKCRDGRVLSENAIYASTKLYIRSGGDTYVLDTNACAKLLIATSNYQYYNNTMTSFLVIEEPEAKHWGWVVYYNTIYSLATGPDVGNFYLGAYFYLTDSGGIAASSASNYAIFIVGLPDNTTATLYKATSSTQPYYIFPHMKRTISFDEYSRMYGNVTYLILKPNTLYTMYVYNVDEGRAYSVVILPGNGGEYHESYIGYPFCAVVKITNSTHTIGAALTWSSYWLGYYATINFSNWPTQVSYVKIRNNSTKTLIVASYTSTGDAHDAVVVPPGGEAFLRIPNTTASIAFGDHCSSLTWQDVYGGRVYVYDGNALLDAGPADLAEYVEFINAYMNATMKWWQEALSAILNATKLSSNAFSMPNQHQIAMAVVSNSKTLIQSAVQYSFMVVVSRITQVTGGGFVGVPNSIGAYAAGLLVAFAAALALSKNREDPGDRLAAAAAILLPTAVLLSVFMHVDLFQTAAIAAALLALAYAINAGKL